MKYSTFSFHLTIILAYTFQLEARSKTDRNLNAAMINQKAVGVLLKANGKRYYVSAELCPGGVFLTRPVNENCLCYNGIFQIVRECCHVTHTRIHSDNLEWRMDFKCGSSPEVGNSTSERRPIRVILPLQKPHNRFSSVIITRSLVGNNTAKWRKFDTEDIVIENKGKVDMNGKTQFEIVNIKPLGREIKIRFGKSSQMTACYSGWLTDEGHQNLRVKILESGATPNCCFNITRANTGTELKAYCGNGTIIAEIIDVQSADVDIGQCDQEIPLDAPHIINKRNPYEVQHEKRNDFLVSDEGRSATLDDFIADRGPILVRRSVNSTKKGSNGSNDTTATTNSTNAGNTSYITPEGVIIPRRRGISHVRPIDQAEAINEFIAILRNDLTLEVREPQTPRFQLLKTSLEIFQSVIPNEVVPHVMLKTAFEVFYFLYEELEPSVYPPPEAFNKTIHFLHKCLKHEQKLNFTTIGCPQQIDHLVIDESVKAKLESFYKDEPEEMERVLTELKHVEIRKDMRFIPEHHDIYVEINWKIIDFVHSLCFDYFGKEFNAHTYYENEMENLLKMSVVEWRWLHTKRPDLRYVRGIFPVSDLKLSMKQLDKVVTIGHHLSRYNGSYWLHRPSIPDWDDRPMDRTAVLRSADTPTFPDSDARLIFAKNL